LIIKKVIGEQCYNCEEIGITREHVIPKYLLNSGETGYTIPCCKTCRCKIEWLDNYCSGFFKVFGKSENIKEQEKAFRQFAINNGKDTSLKFFATASSINGETEIPGDIVVNEVTLMRSLHKVCVCISNYLYGRLNETYNIHIFNNFSRLGGYSQYNNTNDASYTEEQTEKLEKARDLLYSQIKQKTVNIYGKEKIKTDNVHVIATSKLVHGAYWFDINIFKLFKILCAVTEGSLSNNAQPQNMVCSVFPIRIDIENLEKYFNRIKNGMRGDSLSTLLYPYPTFEEFSNNFKTQLETDNIFLPDDAFDNILRAIYERTDLKELWGKKAFERTRREKLEGKLYLKKDEF
jgi:hypothetical protein